MIDIDIAPAPSSAPSSSSTSVPQGAADDFAAALEGAGGREPGPRSDRAPEPKQAAEAESPRAESADTDAVADDSTPAAESASDSAEPVTDDDEAAEVTTPEAPALPLDVVALNVAVPEPDVSTDAAKVATVDDAVDVELVETVATAAPDATADGTATLTEIIAGGVAAEDADGTPVDGEDGEIADAASITEIIDETLTPAEAPAPVDGATDLGVAGPDTPVDAAVPAETAPQAASAPPAAVPAPSQPSADVPVAEAPMVDGAEPTVTDDLTSAPAPVPTQAATPAPAMSADAVATAAAEVATPTQVSTPPAATTVDPTAAAEAAMAAEIEVPTPPQQIAEALRDVRRMADGSHRLSLQLYPEELGVVQLEVAVRDGQLHLRAATELDSTRRLLAASMPELREQLADAGVSAGSLEVGAETAGGDRSGRDDDTPAVRSGFDGNGTDRPGTADPVTTTAPGRLDVRL